MKKVTVVRTAFGLVKLLLVVAIAFILNAVAVSPRPLCHHLYVTGIVGLFVWFVLTWYQFGKYFDPIYLEEGANYAAKVEGKWVEVNYEGRDQKSWGLGYRFYIQPGIPREVKPKPVGEEYDFFTWSKEAVKEGIWALWCRKI